MKKVISIISIFCLINSTANARVDGDATKALDILNTPDRYELFFNNEWDNVFAPFTYQSSLFLLIGGLGTYFVFKDDFENKRDENFKKNFIKGKNKDWVKLGDLLGWGALPAGFLAIQSIRGYLNEDEKHKEETRIWQDAEYVTKSVIYTSLMTFALKMSIGQPRPKDKLKRDSFPSGHASSSFAFASAIWLTQGYKWGLAASALATWVSMSRIEDGSHYYHDSIFGAALGISYAIGIYNNHYRRNLPFSFTFTPTNNMDGLMANIAFKY